MTLYEIDKAIEKAILSMADPETGELAGDMTVLDELNIARKNKIENIGLYIKNLKAEADSIKAEEHILHSRRKAKENKVEWLKTYLSNALKGQKFETSKVAMTFRKSTAVDIKNMSELPTQFTTITIEANKTAIKEALKAGEAVSGAELIERQNLQIK